MRLSYRKASKSKATFHNVSFQASGFTNLQQVVKYNRHLRKIKNARGNNEKAIWREKCTYVQH